MIDQLRKIKLLVLDFDGVMTDNKVTMDENGKESVVCNRGDGLGLEMLRKQKHIEIIVLSKEKNKVVAARCKKLGIKVIHGVDDKLITFEQEVKKRKLSFDNVSFVGNDINDIECIKRAGVGIAIADSYPSVLKVADLVTSKKGGDGAVRQICDWILGSEGV
jgi:YrbI family 3-deoxy-D-manno-octulosonate 8-phosphate phosphatase